MKGNRRSLAWAAGDFVILDAGADYADYHVDISTSA